MNKQTSMYKNGINYCKILSINASHENCKGLQRSINKNHIADGNQRYSVDISKRLRFWNRLCWEAAELLSLRSFKKRLDRI